MDFILFFESFNIDLLTLGAASAAIGMLGFIVFLSDPKSATVRAIALLTFITIIHGILNYFSYQLNDPILTLWFIRLVIFFAVWHAFALFRLCVVFPQREVTRPSRFQLILVLFVAFVSILTLTPFVYSGLERFGGGNGQISTPHPAPLIVVFLLTVIGLIFTGLLTITRTYMRAKSVSRNQALFVLIGAVISFILLITFEMVFPAALSNITFVPYTAIFMMPFIGFTAYAIMEYHLLNVKVVATEILAFVLSIVVFAQIILAKTITERIFTTGIFVLVLIFSVLLIRSVLREIEQREEIEQLATNLEIANDKLKELDKLKSQFLSIASHDLRSPLTIIRNFVSLLLEGAYGKLAPAGEEGLRQVFDRATDMAKSVETYLDVSRIEQGRMKYDFIDIALLPLIQNAVKSYEPNAEKKGLKMVAVYDPALEGVKAKIDVAKMNEVFNNLLDNTIKYTPKGDVNISVKREGNIARFTMKDTGVGMTTDTLSHLFQLFRPGEDSKKINPSSTGVGLYITKSHVEAHKGKIWAESEGAGKGSTFIVELPLLV